MTPLRAVLLDIDGTLVDSNDAHALAWVEALALHGHTVAFEPIRRAIGMGGDKLLPAVIGLDGDSAEGRAMGKAQGQIFHKTYLKAVRPFSRVRELVERVQAAGLQVALATSADAALVGSLLKIAELDDLVHVAADKSEVDDSKPAPDVIQVALAKLGLAPHEAVMIGDTPYDVESARRAGVRVIALRCGGHPDEALAHATAVFDDVADLLRHPEDSPLAEVLAGG